MAGKLAYLSHYANRFLQAAFKPVTKAVLDRLTVTVKNTQISYGQSDRKKEMG
jgi:hypothetical protein